MFLQSDGKILTAGGFLFGHMDCSLIRYNPDGALDDSFGVNGIVISGIGNQTNYINSIAVQDSGKIVAVGYSNVYASI
jgi:uncharacterized delta-60 repeat protein